MITENYVSFETAKLLKEKGLPQYKKEDGFAGIKYNEDGDLTSAPYANHYRAITQEMAVKWLLEAYKILVVVDYDYECTDTSYCYKIYRLGEHGKPEKVAVKGVSYDKDGNPTEHIAFYRDYERSYSDYGTYEEACEGGIRYCLENLI